MVSKVISTFLLCIMLISIFKNAVLYTVYEYDTSLFVSVFCENKSRPQLKCEGKCYLAKMQEEQDKEDAANMLKQLQSEWVYYNSFSPIYIAEHEVGFVEEVTQTEYYNKSYSFLFTSHLVKPPEAIRLS